MPDDIDRDHPEFEVWNSAVGQALDAHLQDLLNYSNQVRAQRQAQQQQQATRQQIEQLRKELLTYD